MDEFSDIVDNIYKSFFGKFWGKDDFAELKHPRRTIQQNMDIYDFLTDRGYRYDMMHGSYSDPEGNPVLNPEYVYLKLKNQDTVPWASKYPLDENKK